MARIELLKTNKDIDKYADFFVNALPDGYLYNASLKNFIKGFLGDYQEYYTQFETAINDLFILSPSSIYLDEFKIMYGLPNILFPDIKTADQAVFAISMMKLSRTLISKEDYENFMLLLGLPTTFYSLNNSLLEHEGFDYGFPITFSPSISTKDKLTLLVYVQESGEDLGDFNNIGDAFDLDFVASPNKSQEAKKILDFLKPDYLLFEYIDASTKTLYGL